MSFRPTVFFKVIVLVSIIGKLMLRRIILCKIRVSWRVSSFLGMKVFYFLSFIMKNAVNV